ncbi:lipase family protein [Rhodococcus sp. CC-R104]|uniref:Lipase family protein n=1 Tax=Rhodococcus chondri TaxID=3065941 RepID=A0ABU7JPB2_9NOCA|nr:lipase family protein [Rhodococcus sp. CC-R104]MEE2031868.1 lipase family protein [Rhodococcus sp. CC-R104]
MAVALATPAAAGAETASGSVIDAQPLAAQLSVPGAASTQKFTYRTQWRSGESTTATGVLFVPPGASPAGGRPVVAWAHGTTGLADECAPSRNPRTSRDTEYLDHWLAQGYAVVAADYPGLGSEGLHRYLDGQSAANSIVDSVRAARAVEPALSDRWVVIGQSQGGHAALHTAHLAHVRAPELNFRGTVTTGAPSNLELLYPLGFPGFPDLGLDGLTAFSAYIFAGLRTSNPSLDVDSYLTDVGREVVDAAEGLCYDDLKARYAHVEIGQLLARPLADERFRAAFADYLGVPTTGYDRPLFIGQGLRDSMVPPPLAFKLAADLWAGGAQPQFRTYPTGHSETMFASLPDSTPFVSGLVASP